MEGNQKYSPLIFDLSKYYTKGKKVAYTRLRGKKIPSIRTMWHGPVRFVGKNFVYTKGGDGYYRAGKHSMFLYPYGEDTAYKVFVFYTRASEEDIKMIHVCHNLLAKYQLAPKSLGIIEVDVMVNDDILAIRSDRSNNRRLRNRIALPGKGYALMLEKIKPRKKNQSYHSYKPKFISRLKVVCNKYGITRRNSLRNIVIEANTDDNLIYNGKYIYLVDIDNRWTTSRTDLVNKTIILKHIPENPISNKG